jgi:hypothetical protein
MPVGELNLEPSAERSLTFEVNIDVLGIGTDRP